MTPEDDEIYIAHVGWLTYERGDDVLRCLREGWFEYREQAFLWLYLRDGDVVVDCGAHAGLYSTLSAAILRNQGRVIAIEPHPRTVTLLSRNLQSCNATCATVVEAALSSFVGAAPLYPGGPARSAYSSMFPIDGSVSGFQVKTTTVDALCEEQRLERIDFFKVDAEGSELQVLEGASRTIGRGRLPVVMVEFTEANLVGAGLDSRKLFEEILSRGYLVCRFDRDLCQLEPIQYEAPIQYENCFATTDLLMVNRRLREAAPQRQRIARELLRRGALCDNLRSQLDISEADRATRLKVIEERGDRLAGLDAERSSLTAEIDDLRSQLDMSEADRAARLKVIAEQGDRLARLDAERAEEIDILRSQLDISEADRAARLKVIDEQGEQLARLEAERSSLAAEIDNLRSQLDISEADRAAMRQSLSWKLTAPLRLAHRAITRSTPTVEASPALSTNRATGSTADSPDEASARSAHDYRPKVPSVKSARDPAVKIVSIHAPKAAGTSLLHIFHSMFGEASVLRDYDDDPANPFTAHNLDPEGWLTRRPTALPGVVKVVHGHFPACKYDLLSDAIRVTFLRHPVDNLISIYLFWRRLSSDSNPLHRYFVEQKLDIFGFARLPSIRYLLSRSYFGDWDMGRLDFIGRFDRRAEDLRRLGILLGLPIDEPLLSLHVNQTLPPGAEGEREALKADRSTMDRLADILIEDIRFYERYAL